MNESNIWTPHPGSQVMFLTCPVYECLYEGTRGNGKTQALIVDFCLGVGKGYGPAWKGIIFRRSFPELEDIITKTKILFGQIYGEEAKYNHGAHRWVFPGKEELHLKFIEKEDDYWKYHGHEYPWIAFEELTNWADDKCYEAMKSCCRSSFPGIPKRYRSTANPWGVGHNWVKSYFMIGQYPSGTILKNKDGLQRTYIHGEVWENLTLLKNDPDYLSRLKSIPDPNKRKAWLEGRWDVVAGGAVDDLWNAKKHLIRPFRIPKTWYIDRSFDWGDSRPFSVGWWAESDGSSVIVWDSEQEKYVEKFFPKGTLFRIAEWYGWNGQADRGCRMLSDQIAKGIIKAEKELAKHGYRVNPGPADTSIFEVKDGHSISDGMESQGVIWTRSIKTAGSRVNGLALFRQRLENSLQVPMQNPGIFIFDNCRHFRRTIPSLPRDQKKVDDVDTSAEDHCFDDQTEILTDQGWKLFSELNKTEKVATMNKDYQIEFQKPYKYISNSYEGYMKSYESNRISICVTDKHRLPLITQFDKKKSKINKWVNKEVGSLSHTYWIPRTGTWNAELGVSERIYLPKQINGNSNQVESIDLKDFLLFYGLWITDGCMGKYEDGVTHRVLRISQKKYDIESIIKNLGYKYSVTTYPTSGMKNYDIQSKQLYDYVYSEVGNRKAHEKMLPMWMLSLPKEYLEYLYLGIMIGDSTKNREIPTFSTTSKIFADQFQELVFKLGLSCTIKTYQGTHTHILGVKIKNKPRLVYRMMVSNINQLALYKNNWKDQYYKGIVHCVCVENETIYVRRKGTPYWSGNCWDETRYRLLASKVEGGSVVIKGF